MTFMRYLSHLILKFSKTPEDYESQAELFEIKLDEGNYHFMRKKFLTCEKEFYTDEKIVRKETWKLKVGKNEGKLHNWKAPAVICWYDDGTTKFYEEYRKNGNLHRDEKEGPARSGWYINGNKMFKGFFKNGYWFRDKEEKPIYIKWNENGIKECEEYLKDDKSREVIYFY